LQLADPEQQVPVSPTSIFPIVASKRRNVTILLVEDEKFVRDIASEILHSAGYGVLQARNAAEALRIFHGHPEDVQLLLTDVVLPDRNGCDLACEVLNLIGGLKVIFVSGYAENCVTRGGLQHPGWSYLPKPFSAAALLQMVKKVMNVVSV
jgi:two-component system, cell cycle sensor histidine kinase and response regulator CckA